jgi:hypothetical protein
MSTRVNEKELLERFGLVTEQALATILGVKVKTLKNRPADKLPKFRKEGRRRLFEEESVREFLRPK